MNQEHFDIPDELEHQNALSEEDLDVCADLLDEPFTVNGLELRPVKVSTIAMLMRTNSALVRGESIEDCPDMLVDCAKFAVMQSQPLKEAARLSRPDNSEELEDLAFELVDSIEPDEAGDFIIGCVNAIHNAQDARVEPVVEDDEAELESLEDIADVGKT